MLAAGIANVKLYSPGKKASRWLLALLSTVFRLAAARRQQCHGPKGDVGGRVGRRELEDMVEVLTPFTKCPQGGMGLPQRLKVGIRVTQARPIAICSDGVGLEGP